MIQPRLKPLLPPPPSDEGGSVSSGSNADVSGSLPTHGPSAVPVEAGDTEDALAARILGMEHRLYPLALKLVASGAAWLENGRVEFAGDGVTLSLWPQL